MNEPGKDRKEEKLSRKWKWKENKRKMKATEKKKKKEVKKNITDTMEKY